MTRLSLDQINVDLNIIATFIPRWAYTLQGRWDHPRVIEDHDIASVQIARQVPDSRIFQPAIAMHHKQARGVLRLDGPQGDVFFRKLKIEGRQIGQVTPLSHHCGHSWQVANRGPPRVRFFQTRQPLCGIGALNEGFRTLRFR